MRKSTIVVLLLVLAALALPAHAADEVQLSVGKAFSDAVDLEAIRLSAVQEDGRVKTFDSLAREKLKYVNAKLTGGGLDPVLVYLDMMLVPEHYAGSNVILLRKPAVRAQLIQSVRSVVPPAQRAGVISEGELERISRTGLVSQMFLDHPAVRGVLAAMQRDVMRTSKEVDAIEAARNLSDAGVLESLWRAVPPRGGSELDPWLSVHELRHAHEVGGPFVHPASAGAPPVDPQQAIARAWNELASAWRFQDAKAASLALNTLARSFTLVEPKLYPSHSRLEWEHWYYKYNKLTLTWLVYFFAVPPLLMAAVFGFGWARKVGLALFVAGFALQTFSIALRWWLAGRIPNANMFEAITASAWFGGLVAIVLELVLRRWPVKNLPALAASVYAMFGLMVGHFMPVTVSSDIGTVMPVLDRTIWLYIHTNMVISSYALIFFASVTAALYLVLRAANALVASPRLEAAWAGAGGVGAVRGGAGSIILGRGVAPGGIERTGLARALDGATMIFLEVAFVTLWVGTLLGAVWADVSWGRPWGWDPKEVFALNTWIVFLILVHVRLKVKDKALWTAILAVIGCAVMLFNWIAVNFVIVGLHSYA
ncbi:MAG: cytochrome c biogenesis protein CcsA [Acidobacteria bacterium]|nr:cytochrome c biogenesis protein CcsA [Acidobacteriota bacterium]